MVNYGVHCCRCLSLPGLPKPVTMYIQTVPLRMCFNRKTLSSSGDQPNAPHHFAARSSNKQSFVERIWCAGVCLWMCVGMWACWCGQGPWPIATLGRGGLWLSVCTACALRVHCVRTACALRAHCVHIVHAEARILTQEYLSPVY